jgi:hypothetical protein
MKRLLHGTLAAVLVIGLAATAAEAEKKSAPAGAVAKKAKAKKGEKKGANAIPPSDKIAESMADLKWGMSKEEMLKKFIDRVKEKYRPIAAKTNNAVEEDRLRQEARQKMDDIRKSAVDFDGKTTGWDVSFLKGEFTHGNDESMLVVKDENSQNFYFFIGGKFWKWYKAFDASVFPGGNFGTFASAVQRRFGPGKDSSGELRPGEGQRHWLEWQDPTTGLKAIDQTDFYGFFCLSFEEKATKDKLASLRSNAPPPSDKHHALVDSVTSERQAEPDDAPNITDRLTGKIRQREQAPEDESASNAGSSNQGKGAKAKKAAPGSGSPVSKSDDPISGLGL